MDPTPETAPARMWRPVPRHFRGSMGKSAKSLGYHGLGVDMSQKMKFLQFYMIIKHGDSSITIWNKENGNNEYGWYNGLVWINSNINDRCKTGLRVHWTLKNPGPIRTWPSLFGTVRWPNVPMAWSRQPDHCTVSCTPGIFIYVRFFTMLPTNFSPETAPKWIVLPIPKSWQNESLLGCSPHDTDTCVTKIMPLYVPSLPQKTMTSFPRFGVNPLAWLAQLEFFHCLAS